jgi:beta-N-acetylhexosaminidase
MPAAVADLLVLAFEGLEAPSTVLDRVRRDPPAGFTLFTEDNVHDVEQVRQLTDTLQSANGGELPLLMAADQEGGQLIALTGTTPFPGNMALGAAGAPELTRRVGSAIGVEMLAAGVNLNYAPCADLNTNPGNPSLGIRSFGDEPGPVAEHVAAFVSGIRSAGVLATVKHFPGKGNAQVDSHFGLPVIAHNRARLDQMELVPFLAGLEAGADLVMTGHFAIPGLTERDDLPSTLSPAVLTRLLRDELGFGGAVITDAFDMGAIAQGTGQVIDAIAAIRAGVDLLLLKGESQAQVEQGLDLATRRGLIPPSRLSSALANSRALRTRVAAAVQPDLSAVGSAEHLDLAAEVAQRAVTLVRNDANLLPLQLGSNDRLLAVMPRPRNLTPADTSSMVPAGLAAALRRHHDGADEFLVGHPPGDDDISAARARAGDYAAVVVGTISASMDEQQAAMVRTLIASRVPVVTVALRTPYDLAAYPAAATYACTYGIRRPMMEALAAALFGKAPFGGTLPVTIAGLYQAGHGLELAPS